MNDNEQPPCDGGCDYNSGPEETCSRHGRPVAQVWAIVDELQARIAEKDATIQRVREVLARVDVYDYEAGSASIGDVRVLLDGQEG